MRLPRPRHRLLELTVLVVGCVGDPPDGTPDAIDPGPPAIVDLALTCDLDADRWTLRVSTDAWSGGGTLWFTVDGAYVERHGFGSVSAAPDGSADALELGLGVVSDWRDVNLGSSTAFPCAADPSAQVTVRDLDGQTTDCRRLGPEPALLDHDGVPECVSAR